MPRFVKVLAVVLTAAALLWVLRLTVLAPEPVPVQVASVERGRVEETVTNTRAGTVEARRRAKLSPEIGGRVVELPYREGQRVAAGEVVLRTDDSLQRAQLEVAERELEAAQAQAEEACLAADLARREVDRNRRLADEGIVSGDLLDKLDSTAQTSAAGCRAAERNVERARAAVGLARAELDKTVLRAPFDAVVAELSTELGEWTTPSPPALPVPPVVDLLDPDSLYVSAPMDEVDSARLALGQQVWVTADPFPGQRFAGRVMKIAPYVLDIEQQNRTVEIEVELEGGAWPETLLPGASADVEVLLDAREDVLRIPTQALVEGSRVLVVGADGVLVERDIETGLRNWDFTEVTIGLAEGDRVVLSLDRPEVEAGAEARVEG